MTTTDAVELSGRKERRERQAAPFQFRPLTGRVRRHALLEGEFGTEAHANGMVTTMRFVSVGTAIRPGVLSRRIKRDAGTHIILAGQSSGVDLATATIVGELPIAMTVLEANGPGVDVV